MHLGLFLSVFFVASTAVANIFIGQWRGYCKPYPPDSSRVCDWIFDDEARGSFNCRFYENLRCRGSSHRQTEMPFEWKNIFPRKASSLVKINFSNNPDYKSQISRFSFFDNLMVETGIQVEDGNKILKGPQGIRVYFTKVKERR